MEPLLQCCCMLCRWRDVKSVLVIQDFRLDDTHILQPLMCIDCNLSSQRFSEDQYITNHCIFWPDNKDQITNVK